MVGRRNWNEAFNFDVNNFGENGEGLEEEAIEYWGGLIDGVYFGISDVVGSLRLTERNFSPNDDDSYGLIQFIRVVASTMEQARGKAEVPTHPSLCRDFRCRAAEI